MVNNTLTHKLKNQSVMNAVCCISKIEDTLHLDIAYGIDYMN